MLDVLKGTSTPPCSTVVANRLEVGAYYTAMVAAGCTYGASQDGANIISGVTAGSTMVASVKASINAKCGP
jgi:hypothetical protein